ncbi:hypothetical protein [Candidatus Ichthyocystis hellenicum]|uniref:hypothetical protein n=1 Tax=Candidatus Ichthyocystis hellenicum TaxID=1561003 RepID=UPI000B855A46|nr:hypothetical protein [Candidatus Ichthyocystis hellenicum]
MDSNMLTQLHGGGTPCPVAGADSTPKSSSGLQALNSSVAVKLAPPPYNDISAPPPYDCGASSLCATTLPSLVVTFVQDVGQNMQLEVEVTTRGGVRSQHSVLMEVGEKINKHEDRCPMSDDNGDCSLRSPCFFFRLGYIVISSLSFFVFGMALSYILVEPDTVFLFIFSIALLCIPLGFFIGYQEGDWMPVSEEYWE